MVQDVTTCLAVCSFAPHSQAVVKAIPHLRVSKRSKPTAVRRRLSMTHAVLGKLIFGGVGLNL